MNVGPEHTIHARVAAVAARMPERVAVRAGSEMITYATLEARANQLAQYLRAASIGPEIAVGLQIAPSVDLVVAMLGILKAGGCYLPLDPGLPEVRVAALIAEASAPVLVTAGTSEGPDGVRILDLVRDTDTIAAEPDNAPHCAAVADNAAYVIYTSGSTGVPKGAIVPHTNVLHLFDATVERFGFGPVDRWSLFHSHSFDFSVWEIWGALLSGAELVVVPSDIRRDPAAFYRFLAESRVTVLNQTPSAFLQLSRVEDDTAAHLPLALRLVIFGGEALRFDQLGPWIARHGDTPPRLVNMYGITETTVHVTWREIAAADVTAAPEGRLGVPIPGAGLRLLDSDLRSVAPGEEGEICITGPGLARGYLKRPGLTADRFRPDPNGQGTRLYRAGDIARAEPDGDLIYAGRVDRQVKVRGHRIELGEIEAMLRTHLTVADVAVVPRVWGGGDIRLVAYVVPAGSEVESNALRDWLRTRLPDYMLPAAILPIDALPLTRNGKLDREALPDPSAVDALSAERADSDQPCLSKAEKALAGIFREVVGVARVGPEDNFFDIGGDSILSVRVAALAKAQGLDVAVHDIFKHQTVARLAAACDANGTAPCPVRVVEPFALVTDVDRARLPAGLEDAYPLAKLQAGLIYHSRDRSDYQVYVSTFRLAATWDEQKMCHALARLEARHPMLRTSFDLTNFSEPLQLVRPPADIPIAVHDISHLGATDRDAHLETWIETEKIRPFDWSRAPLLRFTVHLLGPGMFQLTMAEPLLDGWSVATVMSELLSDYAALLAGTPLPHRTHPGLSYADFVEQEREATASEEHRNYWRKLLSGHTRAPIGRPTPDQDSRSAVIRVEVPVPEALGAALADVARQLGAPLKSVLLAAHLRVVGLVSGETDVLTGIVANGRPEEAGADSLVGLFLNTLPLRGPLLGNQSWADLVRLARAAESGHLPHRHYPLAQIQKQAGGLPLFDTVFNFTHFHVLQRLRETSGLEVLDATASDQTYFALTAQFNLDDRSGRLSLALDCAPSVIGYSRADTIGGYYLRALAAIAADPAAGWAEADLLARDEWARLASWARAAPAPEAGLVPVEVAAAAARAPDAPALLCDGEAVRYAALEARANGVARALRAAGAGPETPVGAYLGRGPEMVAGLLGALRCGAAVVPLDPAYPAARLRFMLADAGVAVAVSERALANRLAGLSGSADMAVVLADEVAPATSPPEAGPGRENLAYVIYTSGSTGRPKGVMLRHGALADLIGWARQRHDARDRAGVLASTSISFDLSLFELFLPLASGGTAILAPDALALATLADRDAVRLVNTVPSAIAELLRQGAIPDRVRTINLAGEPLRRDLVAALLALPGVARVQDLYGPSEDTTYSTAAWRTATGPETIGQPIAGTRAQLLDAMGAPVPPGTAGEICLGGAGLARGYLGQPGLTAARFLPDPTGGPGARLYRTGDLGRHLPDGQLEYLGRIDHQIKLRGYRIELGEIEAALAAHPQVAEAAAVARDSATGRQVIGHAALKPEAVQAEGGTGTAPTPETLRQHLAERLPRWMLPARILLHEALPRTPNGKLDRKSLPDPDTTPAKQANGKTRPKSDTEVRLAQIWADVFGLEDVGIDDNFFALGGDSILSIQIVARANEAGIRLTHGLLFQHETIARLAEVITAAAPTPTEVIEVDRPLPLTPIQHWFFEQDVPNLNHWNQAVRLEADAIDHDRLARAVAHLIAHHDALRLRFEKRDGQWCQRYVACGDPALVHRVDLADLAPAEQEAAISRAAADWQSRLDITDGPLLRVVHFARGVDTPDTILAVIHHLAVDGVSWRILLEDLQASYASGGAAPLPAKTTAFGIWALRLAEQVGDPKRREELVYWTDPARHGAAAIPVDLPGPPTRNTEASACSVKVALTPEETDRLLRQVPAVFDTRANGALVAALVEALADWTGETSILVDIEGHGREPMDADVDLSRTVGWFTSIYPVLLNADAGDLIASVRAQLRAVPSQGLGHGILRYLDRDPTISAMPRPDISFNYLGQFSRVLADAADFRPASGDIGPTHGPQGIRRHLLEVRGGVFSDCLEFDWVYSKEVHAHSTIESLAEAFLAALRRLIARTATIPARRPIPGDFPLARLEQDALDRLLAGRCDVEDIYPLAPLQEGMLFHALYTPSSTAYCMQIRCELEGMLDQSAFVDAWQSVVQCHGVLRTWFPIGHDRGPLQIVDRSAQMPIVIEDWRMVSDATAATRLDVLVAQDRQTAFDLASPPLSRLLIIRLADDRHACIWTYHHLVLDGWSAFQVLREVFETYAATVAGNPAPKSIARPFRDFVDWLGQRDETANRAYWREALNGFAPPQSDKTASAGLPRPDKLCVDLGAEATAALRRVAATHRLTLNTLVQGAWALSLACSEARADVLFGATVAGRPPELSGVATMVGAFINTLPIRTRIARDENLVSWLGLLQHQQAAMQGHEHVPLARIRDWCELSGRGHLFDSILVFENFPSELNGPWTGSGLEVRNIHTAIDEHYPMVLVAEPGNSLSLELKFDRESVDRTSARRRLDLTRLALGRMAEDADRTLGAFLDAIDSGRDDDAHAKNAARRQSSRARLGRLRR
jgi:microcystin synthetase protein McyA